MLNISRVDIYDYLKGLFYDVVTKNYYEMDEPEELTESDTKDGFLVSKVGDFNDESEFDGQAYAWVRCYVYAYVPKLKRGRFNKSGFKAFEDSINDVITNETDEPQYGDYAIAPDTLISADGLEDSQKGNQYHIFVKSFVVTCNASD